MQNHTVSRRDMLKLTGLATVFGLFTPYSTFSRYRPQKNKGKSPLSSIFPCRKRTILTT